MSDLPNGWESVQLGNVVLLKTGPFGSALHQYDYVLGGTPLINPTHIQGGRLAPDPSISVSPNKTDELKDFKLAPGDVVMGRRGEMGRCAVVTQTAEGWLCGTGSVIVRPSPAVLPKFIQRFLSAPVTVAALVGDSVGSTMVNLNQKILLGLPLGLPPVVEQRRIADKLDTVLTRVDAVKNRLARIAPTLKRFRQSVLAAATSGRLTEDWRAKHDVANWKQRTVESLCLHIGDGPFGSNLKSDDYTEHGARVVRLENIGHLNFEVNKKTFISLAKYKSLKKYTLVEGDLLFSSFVDEEVRVCEFPGGISEPTINKADCFCVRVDTEQVNRRFLAFRLACRTTYEDLKAQVHGATRPRINLSQLRGFNVDLPSLEEQAEIVSRVETLFAFASRLEERLKTAQTATERLTPSLLAKAFRGELVPQDPNDEPASELLRRLAKTSPASPSRGRRKAATTA